MAIIHILYKLKKKKKYLFYTVLKHLIIYTPNHCLKELKPPNQIRVKPLYGEVARNGVDHLSGGGPREQPPNGIGCMPHGRGVSDANGRLAPCVCGVVNVGPPLLLGLVNAGPGLCGGPLAGDGGPLGWGWGSPAVPFPGVGAREGCPLAAVGLPVVAGGIASAVEGGAVWVVATGGGGGVEGGFGPVEAVRATLREAVPLAVKVGETAGG